MGNIGEIKIGNDDELNSPLQSIMHLHDSFCLIFDVRWQTLEVSQIFQISIPFLSFSKIRIQFSFFSQNKQFTLVRDHIPKSSTKYILSSKISFSQRIIKFQLCVKIFLFSSYLTWLQCKSYDLQQQT